MLKSQRPSLEYYKIKDYDTININKRPVEITVQGTLKSGTSCG